MNAFNKSILWSTGLVSVNSTSSFSSSGFAGGVTFVLRSVVDARLGRTELSEIWTGTLGEVGALGLSSGDGLGEGELVAIADEVISGGAALGAGDATAGVSDGCATRGLTEGSVVCVDSGDAATTAGVAFGITCGEGVSVGWTLGCGAGDSLGHYPA